MSELSCKLGLLGEKFVIQKFNLDNPPDIRKPNYLMKNWDAYSPKEDMLVSIKTTSRSLKNGGISNTHFSDYSPRLQTFENFILVLNSSIVDYQEVYHIDLNWFTSLFSSEASDEFNQIIQEWRQSGKNLNRQYDQEWKQVQKYLKNKYYNPHLKFSLKKDHQGQIRCQCYPSKEGLQFIKNNFRVYTLNGFSIKQN